MSITKIDQHDFNQLPILLMVNVSHQIHFNLLYFVETFRQFEDNEQPAIGNEVEISGDIEEEDDKADKIDCEVMRDVVVYYLFDYLEFLACLELDSNKVETYLQKVEPQADALKS